LFVLNGTEVVSLFSLVRITAANIANDKLYFNPTQPSGTHQMTPIEK